MAFSMFPRLNLVRIIIPVLHSLSPDGKSGSENLSGLNRHDNITGLNSVFCLKNQKLHAVYILSDFPCIKNLSSLDDLSSLIFNKKPVELNVFINPSILVSQCWMYHQKSTILLIFGTLSVGGCGGHGC